MAPELYRWNLFDALYHRFIQYNQYVDIQVQDIIFGPEDFLSYTRIFYRSKHKPIIHIVGSYLKGKSESEKPSSVEADNIQLVKQLINS